MLSKQLSEAVRAMPGEGPFDLLLSAFGEANDSDWPTMKRFIKEFLHSLASAKTSDQHKVVAAAREAAKKVGAKPGGREFNVAATQIAVEMRRRMRDLEIDQIPGFFDGIRFYVDDGQKLPETSIALWNVFEFALGSAGA